MKCAFKRVSYVGILLLLGLSIGRVCSQEGGSNNELLEEDSSGEEDGPNFASPTLTIKGTVIPREEQLEEEENILRETSEKEQREKKFSLSEWDNRLNFLIDSWWKLLIWVLGLTFLFCLCCYCSRCCYLIWDCCTDPFWGCCPRCVCCEGFLLMRRSKRSRDELDADFESAHREATATRENLLTPPTREESNKNSSNNNNNNNENAALITSGSVTGSFINESQTSSSLGSSRRKQKGSKKKTRIRSYYPYEDNLSESVAEGLPQVYDTHYFNLLHLFGFRGGKGQYEIAVSDQQMSSRNGADDMSGLGIEDGEEMIDFTLRSTSNNGIGNGNGAVSPSSHNNSSSCYNNSSSSHHHNQSQRSNGHKNGLIIEHGHIGRYQMLPEAESELIPVHIRDKNRALHGSSQNHLSNGYKRKSRSMESFGINAQRNRQSQSYSVAQSQVDIAEVPIASSPTAATASVTSKEPTRSMKSQYSQTDLHVDAESDVIMAPSAKVRTASIGRSTQCPLPKPPKRTSASVYGHKRNGSIRSMNDIEKEILYGRETMLA